MNMKPQNSRGWRSSLTLLAAGCVGMAAVCAQPVKLADFQFNEGSGRTTASTVNSLVGTLGLPSNPDNIPVIINDTPSGAANDRAVQLRGVGYLLADDSNGPILNVATEPLTVEAWVKWDGTDPDVNNGILAYGASYKLGLTTSGQIRWTLFGIVDVNSDWYLPMDNLWHHVAAAYEPGVGVTIYLDGVGQFVAETRPMRAFQHAWLTIGAENLGNPILAALDRVRVHKALLSETELDSIATEPKGVLASTLVAYDFNETEMPFQNAKAPARPTITSDQYNIANTTPSFSTDSPTGGAGDYSIEFSVPGQRIVVPDPTTAIQLGDENPDIAGDFTIQAWVKFGSIAARAVIWMNNCPGGAVSFSVLNRKVFVTTLGILDRDSDAPIPDDGGWHHIAVVHENGVAFRFYVDGILKDTKAYTGGVIYTRTDPQFTIGCEGSGNLPYVCKLDRLIVSRGVVPAEELDYRVIPGVDPGAPELTIGTVVEVTWPSLPAGYVLQSTTTIADPESWINVPGTPFAREGTYRFYFPPTAEKTFYRLFKP
ncbi:MAG: LamG domain-containing protein [Verrucomicrobia bacterium]|nr:LamG domain-containing protein [Verrucomicrobiota bacterium]NMD22184.1 LamG domain-containing protein [Verrucomicrobiota bacterium]